MGHGGECHTSLLIRLHFLLLEKRFAVYACLCTFFRNLIVCDEGLCPVTREHTIVSFLSLCSSSRYISSALKCRHYGTGVELSFLVITAAAKVDSADPLESRKEAAMVRMSETQVTISSIIIFL